MAKKKRILITGSGGFVLGNFIRQAFYAKKPYSISSIDRVQDSHIIHNIYVNADHSFHIADIRDPHTLHVIFQKERPDVVIHGAAETGRASSTLSANNVVGTQNIINECLDLGAKLIYISSGEVCGPLGLLDDPHGENAPINPWGLLAATKAAGELLVKAANKSHGLKYNIVRLSNNYGPWQSPDKFIPSIISSILNDAPILIHGQGNQLRDWIHVHDSCSALFSILDSGVDGEIYNVTAKQEFMNLEVAQIICNTLEKGHNLLKHVEDRPENTYRFAMSNDQMKNLGWNPQFKFRDGIQRTCQWCITNKWWLKQTCQW